MSRQRTKSASANRMDVTFRHTPVVHLLRMAANLTVVLATEFTLFVSVSVHLQYPPRVHPPCTIGSRRGRRRHEMCRVSQGLLHRQRQCCMVSAADRPSSGPGPLIGTAAPRPPGASSRPALLLAISGGHRIRTAHACERAAGVVAPCRDDWH